MGVRGVPSLVEVHRLQRLQRVPLVEGRLLRVPLVEDREGLPVKRIVTAEITRDGELIAWGSAPFAPDTWVGSSQSTFNAIQNAMEVFGINVRRGDLVRFTYDTIEDDE